MNYCTTLLYYKGLTLLPRPSCPPVQVLANWLIGRRIVVEEQKGAKRAAYGEHLLSRISSELGADYGEGFSEPQLRNCRLFFKAFPTEEQI